jgi:ABC-type sulfate transport system substrate-binding protein
MKRGRRQNVPVVAAVDEAGVAEATAAVVEAVAADAVATAVAADVAAIAETEAAIAAIVGKSSTLQVAKRLSSESG